MKKLGLMAVLALGGLLLCNTGVMAQDTNNAGTEGKKGGKRGFPTVEERMDRMSKELNLTDDQKPKVKAVLEEQSTKMRGVRDLPQDEQREKFQASREETNKKMKEILTPEQYTKFESMRRGPGGPGGGKKGGKKSGDSQ